ncbi:MAG: hypothetical protein QUS11_08295 [Candidatus Fermentibacter sp.]|nr:hypothetical protein [Candidatus Fermentibacter sp.]
MFRGSYYRLVEILYRSAGRTCPDGLVRLLASLRLVVDMLGRSGRRSVYMGHLARIFPSEGPAWRRGIMRSYWMAHQGAMLGLFRASLLDPDNLDDCVEWEGRAELDGLLAGGRGVLLLAPHFGDERTMHIAMALAGYDMHVLSTDYQGAPEEVRRARLSTSARTHHIAFPSDNPRWMYRALEAGGIVQTAPTGFGGTGGTWVRSFGVPVLAPSTFHRLREATGCAVVIAVNHILPGLRYRICISRLDLPGDLRLASQVLFDRISDLGTAFPRQYNWMNLAIRHRETNTIARLGFVPGDERVLEMEAVPGDDDPSSIRDLASLPAPGREKRGRACPTSGA